MIPIYRRQRLFHSTAMALIALISCVTVLSAQAEEDKKPNIVIGATTLASSMSALIQRA